MATARLFKSAQLLPSKAGLGISARILSANLYGHQFRAAARILNGFDSVLGCESSHNQCQLAVGCRLDGNLMNPLHVFRGASTGTVHFHNKFSVFRGFFLSLGMTKLKKLKMTQERVKRGNLIKFNARLLRSGCQTGSTLTRSCPTNCLPSQGWDSPPSETGVNLVGTARFELATPCTPSKCATRLRYVPTRVRCRGRQRGVDLTILHQEDAASRVSTRPFSMHPSWLLRRS